MINLFDIKDKLYSEDIVLYSLIRVNDYPVRAAITSNGNLTVSAGGSGMTRESVAYFLTAEEATKAGAIVINHEVNKGKGEALHTGYKNADCDIILVSKGYAEDTTDLHNINKIKIKNHLKAQEIPYTDFNLGYDNGLKSTQHTFTIGVKYIG